MTRIIPNTLAEWNALGTEYLPGLLGVTFETVEADCVVASAEVRQALMAPNGFLHAGAVVALADSCCGYGTVANLPDGATGFTTIELKSNFTGTARAGAIRCVAVPQHRGRTTQLWDARIEADEGTQAIAHFRCTQMILWPKG